MSSPVEACSSQLSDRLMDAVEEDDAVKLQEILSSLPKDDASVQDVLAEALFEAVKTGKEEMVKLLVMSGADGLSQGSRGHSPLLVSVITRRHGISKILLDNSNPDHKQKCIEAMRTNPLHVATMAGDLEHVKLFIDAGFDVDLQNRCGDTPLMLAATAGHAMILSKLLESGCNTGLFNKEGVAAIHKAAMDGHLNCVKALVEAKADPSLLEISDMKSTLALAASHGHSDVVEYLLKQACDVDSLDRLNKPPLYDAVLHRQTACAKVLIDHGADLIVRNPQGHSLLHIAAMTGDCATLELLLKSGISVDDPGCGVGTPLLCAAEYHHQECGRILLEAGANPDIKNDDGKTPLVVLIMNKSRPEQLDEDDLKFVKLLLQANSDFNIKLKSGESLVSYTIRQKRWCVLQMLLTAGCKIEDFSQIQECVLQQKTLCEQAVSKWLTLFIQNPLPLRELCRTRIRSLLPYGLHAVDKLPLPPLLKEYLHLTDMVCEPPAKDSTRASISLGDLAALNL